jgi:molybdate transport system substrate-binding protein
MTFLALAAFGSLSLGIGLTAGPARIAVQAAAPSPLLVAAAVSLTEPLQALAPSFARARKVPPPNFNFAASGALQQQIQKGAPVDVFLSAAEKQMNTLEKEGLLLPGTRRAILGNQLVLVVPARSPRRPLSFAGLGSAAIRRIAIGDSTVPAGDYARQTLAYFQLTGAVQARLVPLGSVRAVANAVAAGDVDAGIIYRSDAQNVANLRVVAAAPETSHAPIRYSVAVIRSSRQPALARAYVASLRTAEASQVFRRYGLLPLAATAPSR